MKKHDSISISDQDSTSYPPDLHRQVSQASNNSSKRNQSYVDLQSPLNKRMKDDTLDHPKVLAEAKHPITRICLTGGPCAGKTTALATLSSTLQQMGFAVL